MTTHADIEAQIREIQQRKKEEKQKEDDNDVGLGASGFFDQDIYNGGGKYEGYVTSIAPNDEYDVRVSSGMVYDLCNIVSSKICSRWSNVLTLIRRKILRAI